LVIYLLIQFFNKPYNSDGYRYYIRTITGGFFKRINCYSNLVN